MARFAYQSGDVTWRDGGDGSWSAAATNFPLRQGAQVWVAGNSRAEIQFDDGSRLRLDANTLVTLQTLYSDAQGEFTEITLNQGQASLRLNNPYSQYQVNTKAASLKAVGRRVCGSAPARARSSGSRKERRTSKRTAVRSHWARAASSTSRTPTHRCQ